MWPDMQGKLIYKPKWRKDSAEEARFRLMYKKVSIAPLHILNLVICRPPATLERLTLARLRCPDITSMLQSCAICTACQQCQHSSVVI